MAITLATNTAALNAQRRLAHSSSELSRAFTRLSSGLRINRAGDDAAGLAVASQLKVDSRVYAQSVRNVNDGISFLNIAQGALGELTSITVRQIELAEQAANGVYSNGQRRSMDTEADALVEEFNRIVRSLSYNDRAVIDVSRGSQDLRIQAGYGVSGGLEAGIGFELQRLAGDGTFEAPVSYVIGNTLDDVQVGDFNGDGILDLVTAEYNAAASILLGNGNGTFKARISAAAGSGTMELAIGDVNGDGRSDLVYVNYSQDRMSVLLGNGNGTFLARTSFVTGASPQTVAMEDVNADGLLDIVTGDLQDGRLSVFLGNGNGSFRARASFDTGTQPRDVVIADMNGDGRLDLISADSSDDAVSVLLGNGNGSFSTARSYHVGDGPESVVVADFDGDGKFDIATGNYLGNTIALLVANGDGSFQAAVVVPAYAGPSPIVAGDFNGDGYTDLAAADGGDYTTSIFLWNGEGTFSAYRTIATTSFPWGIATGDFNGDDVLDLVTADYFADRLSVMLGNADSVSTIAAPNLSSAESAREALTTLREQLTRITAEVGYIGSVQSRLDAVVSNLAVARENLDESGSRILDADIAEETARLVKARILQQAGTAVLSQANQLPALALRLLDTG